MDHSIFSANIVIFAEIVFAVAWWLCNLKKRSEAAIKIPPDAPIEGRNTTFYAMSAPTVSTSRECVQDVIFVSWRHTTVAPEEMIWLRTLALLAPSFRPRTFQQIILQSFTNIDQRMQHNVTVPHPHFSKSSN